MVRGRSQRPSSSPELPYVARPALPDYGLDARPAWSGLLVWLAPALFSTLIMLYSMAIVLRQRSFARRSGGAIRAEIIEPPVQAPPKAAARAAAPAKPSFESRKSATPAKRPASRPLNNIPRMLGAPLTDSHSAIAMPDRAALSSSEEGANLQMSGGAASETSAAHAIYAPQPDIPDELREDVLQTEAIALFTVSPDGEVVVILTKATGNARLNEALLETLSRWRFFPAVKNGVAVSSMVEVRIPISVQ